MDIKLIFGIKDGDGEIQVDPEKGRPVEMTAFTQRTFGRSPLLSRALISSALKEAARGKSKRDHKDVARLTTLILLATVFIPSTTHSISKKYISCVEDLDKMSTLNWSQHIFQVLKTSLMEKAKDNPKSVSGCVMAIKFWLCEHIQIVEQLTTQGIPRCTRWDLRKLKKSLKKDVVLTRVEERKVIRCDLTPTKAERRLLGMDGNIDPVENEEAQEEASTDEENSDDRSADEEESETDDEDDMEVEDQNNTDDDKSETEPEDDGTTGRKESEDLDETITTLIRKRKEPGFGAPSFNLMDDVDDRYNEFDGEEQNLDSIIRGITTSETITSLEAELNKAAEREKELQKQLAESLGREKEMVEEMSAATTREHGLQAEVQNTHKRVQELENENNSKQKVMEQQDEEIKLLKIKIEELTAKFSYLEEERKTRLDPTKCTPLGGDGPGVPSPMSAVPLQMHYPEPSSLVRNLKARQRKMKLEEQYTYEKKRGRRKAGEEDMDDFVHEIDTMDANKPAKMGENVGICLKQKIHTTFELVDKETKKKYHEMKNICSPEHIIWYGRTTRAYVTLENLKEMLQKSSMPENLMNAYAELLRKSMGPMECATYRTSSHFFDCIYWRHMCGVARVTEEKDYREINEDIDSAYDSRYLLFPFQIKPGKKKDSDPWTLLSFDRQDCCWIFYKPNRDDNDDPDNSQWQVNRIKEYVEERWKKTTVEDEIPQGVVFSQSEFTFRQDTSTSVPTLYKRNTDSGYLVCYMMHQICQNQAINPNLEVEELNRFKSSIFSSFVNEGQA